MRAALPSTPILILILVVLVAVMLLAPGGGGDARRLEARLVALEAQTDGLRAELEQLRQQLADDSAPAAAAGRAGEVSWRFGPVLDGEPLRVAAETVDQAHGRVELLLEVMAPLADAAAWPQQPGRAVPLVLIARDGGGGLIAEVPLTLVRGARPEPGAYLHLAAELPEDRAARLSLIEIRAR